MDADIIVVGAGAVGLACAYELAGAGLAVTVLERGRPGAATSWGNCGLIEPSHADPQTQPAALLTALATAWRRDAPLRIPLRGSLARARWLAGFAARCTEARRQAARRARYELLVYSRDQLEGLLEREGLDCDYRRDGLLTLYRSFDHFAAHHRVHAALAGAGLEFTSYLGDGLERLPLRPAPEVRAAILTRSDGHLQPERYTAGLAAAARRRGVEIRSGVEVRRLLARGGRVLGVDLGDERLGAGAVVLAAGPWSRGLVRGLGLALPLEPARGLSVSWSGPVEGIRHPVYFYERKVVLTPWSTGYRLGSTLEFAGFEEAVPSFRFEPLYRAPGEYLAAAPPVAREAGEQWVGFRPMSVDEKPLIGPSTRLAGLHYACGHGQLGMSLSAGTGALLRDLVLGRAPAVDPVPFLPGRFGA